MEPMSGDPITILLVEDSPADVRLILEILQETGVIRTDVKHVTRLADGLERLDRESYDVLLLDLGLPDSVGLDTFRKAHDHAPDVPIVVLTGFDDQDVALEAVREGAQDYLAKGLVGSLLVRSLRYAIERKRTETALKMYSERLEEMVQERADELRKAQQDLVRKEKLATLGQLAGGVAHELRNPLGVIANAVYFLQETLSDEAEKVREYLALIASEVKASEKIIDDLLGFSLKKSPARQKVSVPELIAGVLKKQALPEHVAVEVDIHDDMPALFVDGRQIEQVLCNLVANACQAMPEGGELTIQSRTHEKKVLLIIRDSGLGISQEHMQRLFEPLFTTKARGMGLGLTVSKTLVEANGGSIAVESEEGKGSTFTLTLPTGIRQPPHPLLSSSAEASGFAGSQAEGSTLKHVEKGAA